MVSAAEHCARLEGLPQTHAGKEGVCMKRLAVHFSRRGSQFSMQRLKRGSGAPQSSTKEQVFSSCFYHIVGKLLVIVNWQVGHLTSRIAK